MVTRNFNMTTCTTCFGYGHLGKPDNTTCTKCNGTGLKKERAKPTYKESDLQTKITKWLRSNFDGIIFFSDFAAGMYISNNYMKNTRSAQACDGKYLDLTILRPSGKYHGLIIEIKCTDDDLFLVDGKTLKSDHVREQYDMILKLRKEGYAADFGVGEIDIKNQIVSYLNDTFINREIIYRRA